MLWRISTELRELTVCIGPSARLLGGCSTVYGEFMG
jgi:hypothetical protein